MQSKLFIPNKIKIGFRERKDTFTGKLAYVIYYDEKNKLRKEGSWNSWRDYNFEPIEFDNKPQSGFILNRGGQRYSDWGNSSAFVRVYDSRDFEFEISIDNLLGILMHSDVSKRDIVEECVYAWHGTNLILLPCNSVEYQESVEYTAKQTMKVLTKELVCGRQYHKKKSDQILTYLGRFDWWEFVGVDKKRYGDHKIHTLKGKKHIFYDGKEFTTISPTVLSSAISEDVVENYPFLVDKFFTTMNSQPFIGIKIIPYTKAVEDVEILRHREYPQLSCIKDDRICLLSTGGYYRGDKFQDRTFFQYQKTFKFGVSIETEVIKNVRPGSYYYLTSYNTPVDASKEYHPSIAQEAINLGFDASALTEHQYIQIMTMLGFGEVRYILQNGTELNPQYSW